jgi:hypothetical protein
MRGIEKNQQCCEKKFTIKQGRKEPDVHLLAYHRWHIF